MTDDKPVFARPDVIREHAELIGRVLQWSDLHRIMGELFGDFSISEEARNRYWATQSDRFQRQLLLSVGSVALKDFPSLREKLEKTLAEIERLAGDRNAAIHTYWAIDIPRGKVLPHRSVPPHKRLRDDFETQFKELMAALLDQWLNLFDIRIAYFDLMARKT